MSVISPVSPLPPSVINPAASPIDKYYQTAYERMAIYHRCFVENRPRPWTQSAPIENG
jgi:hypothetical protein